MVEKYLELIDTKTAAFTSDVVRLSDLVPRQGGGISSIGIGRPSTLNGSGTRDAYVNFDTTGGATLIVEASLGNGSNFHEVEKITDAGVSQITGYPRMRLSLSNVASGTHSAGIYGDVVREGSFIETIGDLQLTGNLRLCLDAGDSNSYSGSGQDWVDVSSAGNADEFHLGSDATSSTDDPTFNGTAGGLSSGEYFSFDGGDFLEYGAGNETWMDTLHKDNAVWTALFWVYITSPDQHGFFDTSNASSTNVGVGLYRDATNALNLTGANGSNLVINKNSTITYDNSGAWNLIGVALDEGAGASGSHWYINGVEEAFDGAYNAATPSSGAATNRMHIGSSGVETGPFPNGTRLAMAAFWQGARLTVDNMDSIYDATKSRFGF